MADHSRLSIFNRDRLCASGGERDPDTIGWCDARWIYLGINTFWTDVASDMPDGQVVRLLSDAGLLVPGGERRSFQCRLPWQIDPDRARVYRLDRQRIEGG